jgi:hypothetical protein
MLIKEKPRMSNSSYVPPVPPVPGEPPKPKKRSWWLYGLIGCAGIIVIGIIVAVAGGMWLWNKVPKNENEAVAFIVEKANPDLEVLSVDTNAGTISVRNKKTGEHLTMSLDDAKNGKFTIETDKGKAVIGAGAIENIPSWVAIYPGSKPEGGFSGEEQGKKTGVMSFTTSDSVSQVIDFYKEKLAAEGLEPQEQGGFTGTESFSVFTARSPDERRTVSVSATRDQEQTRVQVSFEEKAE